jgi:subtilisin family serine protease
MDGLVLPHTLVGAAPEADIVFCNAAGIDSAGVAAADALRFIFKFAEERHQACVVNMSFGSMEGARDGSSDLERVIDSVLNDPAGEPRPGRAVVVAAGNEAKSERHSRKQMAANGQLRFELTVADTTYPNGSKSLPKVAGDKILGTDQIYVWYLAGADLEIRVTPPSGRPDPTGWTKLGDIQVGQSVAVSSGPATPPNGKNYIVITIWAPIPYGHWIIELRERNGVETPVDIWVDSINDAYTTPRFIGSDVIVANTLTCPSTARSAIAVGAYIGTPYKNETKGDICDFSSQGLDSIYGVSASNVRPHIVAPGRLIVSANNSSFADRKGEMNVMTERYGRAPLFHALMSGTSQAAPHVAGVIALMFEKNPRLTWVELKAILARSADKPQAALWSFPNGVWGYGKLNAAQAIAAVP